MNDQTGIRASASLQGPTAASRARYHSGLHAPEGGRDKAVAPYDSGVPTGVRELGCWSLTTLPLVLSVSCLFVASCFIHSIRSRRSNHACVFGTCIEGVQILGASLPCPRGGPPMLNIEISLRCPFIRGHPTSPGCVTLPAAQSLRQLLFIISYSWFASVWRRCHHDQHCRVQH